MPAADAGTVFHHTSAGAMALDLQNSLSPAVAQLARSCERSGGLLSVGLEPSDAYLPAGFTPDIPGYEAFLRTVIDATKDIAAAYKFNLAFFESLGPRGWDLLFRVRQAIPPDAFVIADAKRGDIGTTAQHYAKALYEQLDAHSATVNPMMGRDSAEPFLAYADRLTFFLVLTSNPGAADFLIPSELYLRLARAIAGWNSKGNCGFVVGATNPDHIALVREAAGNIPFLVPGIGAQGGEAQKVVQLGQTPAAPLGFPGLLFHVTRGVLPAKDEAGDVAGLIRAKALHWRGVINAARDAAKPTGSNA